MPHEEIATEGLRSFFERFQRVSSAPDVDALAGMYAPTVMIAGPGGARAISSADLLRAAAGRRWLFESAGHRETALAGCDEQALTDRYSLVRTEWRWRFERAAGESATVSLPSTFIVDRSAEGPRIVVYVMHHDIAAELQNRGLLPPPA